MSRFVPFFPAYTPPAQEKKVFTQKEVEAIERFHLAKLEKEREAKEQAQKNILNLSIALSESRNENLKLKFFVEMLSNTLNFIVSYNGKDKEQQNG